MQAVSKMDFDLLMRVLVQQVKDASEDGYVKQIIDTPSTPRFGFTGGKPRIDHKRDEFVGGTLREMSLSVMRPDVCITEDLALWLCWLGQQSQQNANCNPCHRDSYFRRLSWIDYILGHHNIPRRNVSKYMRRMLHTRVGGDRVIQIRYFEDAWLEWEEKGMGVVCCSAAGFSRVTDRVS